MWIYCEQLENGCKTVPNRISCYLFCLVLNGLIKIEIFILNGLGTLLLLYFNDFIVQLICNSLK